MYRISRIGIWAVVDCIISVGLILGHQWTMPYQKDNILLWTVSYQWDKSWDSSGLKSMSRTGIIVVVDYTI